ncbi:hypothetical protein MKX03_020356 [Papaver bracteatum]|nr:hypothetical protein MKX03_020356 [Papaver bracteatum]
MQDISNITEEYTCVEIEAISHSVRKMLENSAIHSGTSRRCSIHRVPDVFHKMTEPSKYRPQAISIGPFHCGDQTLKANESLKLRYAHSLLAGTAKKRFPREEEEELTTTTGSIELISTGDEEEEKELATSGALITDKGWFTIFEECVTSIKKIESKARRCYSEPIDLNSGEFVKMMVIDGLFIIELLIEIGLGKVPFEFNLLLGNRVTMDLLLLENQLPLFVLKCLFDQIELPAKIERWSLMDIIVYFLSSDTMNLVPEGTNHFNGHGEQCEGAKHLLDLLGTMLQLLRGKETSLNRAGVRFKKGSKTESFMDVKFCSEGIFEIPPTDIYNGTDTVFRNLIACEQLYSGRYDMTSYSVLMDSLINSAEDVAVLREAGIFRNFLGCDEDVSNIFNKLGLEVILKENSYSNLEKKVHRYYKKRRHIWKATLKREYFNNPWAIISVFAAGLLILLTIISTVFGILQVVLPKK